MTVERDPQFLLDMLQSAELALAYTADCTKEDFLTNIQLQDAVIRRLLIIAEAARRVSPDTRQTSPEIAWREINGMRNRLVHEYDSIDLNIVWGALQQQIPTLVAVLKTKVSPDI
jgi:uncharacterized protein with HEPN domain